MEKNDAAILRKNLINIQNALNNYLSGVSLEKIAMILKKIEKNHIIPNWYYELLASKKLSKTDPKSIGTLIEKLVKAEIMRRFAIVLNGNSAYGVDIPELECDIKATKFNAQQCSARCKTAYQRILGLDHNLIVVLYKGKTMLEIVCIKYYAGKDVADESICKAAKELRYLISEDIFSQEIYKRCLRIIVFSNKVDFNYNQIFSMLSFQNKEFVEQCLSEIESKDDEITEFALPNDKIWKKFMSSSLSGKIGVSNAFQQRLQFKIDLKREMYDKQQSLLDFISKRYKVELK